MAGEAGHTPPVTYGSETFNGRCIGHGERKGGRDRASGSLAFGSETISRGTRRVRRAQ